MSFSCQGCGKQVGPGVKMTKIVIETRPVEYKGTWPHTHGTETVEEIGVCPECAADNAEMILTVR